MLQIRVNYLCPSKFAYPSNSPTSLSKNGQTEFLEVSMSWNDYVLFRNINTSYLINWKQYLTLTMGDLQPFNSPFIKWTK